MINPMLTEIKINVDAKGGAEGGLRELKNVLEQKRTIEDEDRRLRRKAQRKEDFWDSLSGMKSVCFIYFMIILFFMGTWVIRSFYEASVYETRTGKPVSTWEAMFVQFRIIHDETSNH